MSLDDRIDDLATSAALEIKSDRERITFLERNIIQQVSGQFLMDPNEVNGWGAQGFVDSQEKTPNSTAGPH